MPLTIDKDTELYLSVSSLPSRFGVTVYNALFEEYGINAVYLWRKAPRAEALVQAIRAMNVRGASVSMPLKNQVIEFLDGLDKSAEQVQSVNTIVRSEQGLIGHNTDVVGAEACLRSISFETALVYGSGSVTDSILSILKKGNKRAYVLARNMDRARQKGQAWGAEFYQEQSVDLMVNATPLSLEPLAPEVTDILKRTKPTVFDLVVPRKGNYLEQFCRAQGLRYMPGFAMYQHQFVRQLWLYTGLEISPEKVQAIAEKRGLI